MLALLAAGIALRLAVFYLAGPFNPDRHYDVIAYVVEHHALPVSNELSQSYHPPLYYLLMAPLQAIWDSPTPIHRASFVLSSINLALICWLLSDRQLIQRDSVRYIAMAAACFLPQFVMFNSFVSNDALALPVGTLLFATAWRYVRSPTSIRLVVLAFMVAAGLLTKGTFILTGPAMTVLVIWVELRRSGFGRIQQERAVDANPDRVTLDYALAKPHPAGAIALRIMIFCLIWLVLGSYKYVENFTYFGHPIVHNLDAGGPIADMQRGVWKGPQTLFDINVIKLIRHPILQIRDVYSYPLLMYATFWYPHIPDSSFTGNITGYAWVGSAIYALGVVPTIAFLIGLISAIRRSARALLSNGDADDRLTAAVVSMLLLLSNVVVVIAAGVKYDIWSCFQSRLCFQSMVPILLCFAGGMAFFDNLPRLRRAVEAICWLTLALCLVYFAIEFGLVYELLPRGAQVQP